ncbi:DoxX family protein [Streptomyces megasporus]|uniref:DoxX family protein n=1 Tax=Streptomyces megasporus TaxID=44060 RepID=UPI001FDFEF0F|nr:DoxX family protein [Streptomyces megasporus]
MLVPLLIPKPKPMSKRADLGLLVLRAGTGGVLFAHGAQKLFGWFGGHGLEGTRQAMEQMGFEPGRESALAAGLAETGGGTLLALGLATPAAGAAVVGTMAGAVSVHAPAGFFVTEGGYEYPAFLGFVAACLAATGPGRYSLDRLLGHRLNRPWMTAACFAASAAAAAAVLRRRAGTLGSGPEQAAPPGAGSAPD